MNDIPSNICPECGWGVTREMGCPNPDCTRPGRKAVRESQHDVEPVRPKSKSRTLALVTLLLVTVAGSWFTYEKYQEHKVEQAAATTAQKKEEATEKAEADRVAAIDACKDEIGEYVSALVTVDARLDVGVNVDTLSELVGTVSVEKAQIDEDDLAADCEPATEQADRALELYTQSVSSWEACIWNDYCNPDYDLNLQELWASATGYVERAEELMNGEDGESA